MKEIDELIKQIENHLIETEGEDVSHDWDDGYLQGCENCIGMIKQLKASLQPVVPKEVAEWLDYSRQCMDLNAVTAAEFGNIKNNFGEEKAENIIGWIRENGNDFAMAFITGNYTVAKEKLYYVKLPELGYLIKNKGVGHTFLNSEKLDNERLICKFTESEIKAIDERYWQFAVEVEEEE